MHITSNTCKGAACPWIHGVEIRELHSPRPLAFHQSGLFAASPFQQFDILGEYCGEMFDTDDGGRYATYLETDMKSMHFQSALARKAMRVDSSIITRALSESRMSP